MSRRPLLFALVILMTVGWSGNYVAGKIILREVPPLLLAGLRVTVAGAAMIPLYIRERRKHEDRWTRADLPLLLLLGILGVALNQFCFVMGLSRTSAAHAAIFANMTPVIVLLLAVFQGLEKFTAPKVAGMAVALGGVVLLETLEAKPRSNGPSWTGDMLVLAGCFAFSLFTVLGKPAARRLSTVTVNTFAYVGGALAMSPVTLWQSAGFSFGRVSVLAWACLLYMALVSSVSCYLIFYYALAHMSPSRVSTFSYLQPPLAAGLAIVLLGEHVTLALVLCAAMILAGVYLTEQGR